MSAAASSLGRKEPLGGDGLRPRGPTRAIIHAILLVTGSG
jgi:hypothetical protein